MPFDFEIDLDNMYPETWFGDTPGKRVCLRLCPPEKVEEFRKDCLKPQKKAVLNTLTRKMELVDNSEFDSDEFIKKITSYSIADWDLDDVNGKVIEYNEKNKRLLLNMPKFMEYVTECLKSLTGLQEEQREAESKN